MPQSTMTYALQYVKQNIPEELLHLAFRPGHYQTTWENRVISEIVEGPILQDTNLVGGKRKEIFLNNNWRMNLKSVSEYNLIGSGVQGSFYLIPPHAREHRNISSVVGITPSLVSSLPGSSVNYNGTGSFGNTVQGMLSEMLNTRTFGSYPNSPQVTLEGTNIVRFFPEQIVDGVAITAFLEYDSEFINFNQSAIFAMQELVLCAVKRYIAVKLRVKIDETEVVAGMEIGVIKDKVIEYEQAAENYRPLLIKLKGAMHYEPRAVSRLIYHSL